MAIFRKTNLKGGTDMESRKIFQAGLASILIMGSTVPVFAQGILDRMKEDAQRRAENKAVMEAEHPKDNTTAAAPAANTSTPATTAPATAPAPSTTEAQATPAPAPAQ
jgi:hypothetical protein